MPKINSVIRILLLLFVWSMLLIGMIQINNSNNVLLKYSSRVITLENIDQNDDANSMGMDFFDPSGLLIDNETDLDYELLAHNIEARMPSLPIASWSKNENQAYSSSYPSIFDLEFNNIYWQTMRSSNGTYQLFGAYYDIRHSPKFRPKIRILAMIDRFKPKANIFCQLWFDGEKKPVTTNILKYNYIWLENWGVAEDGIYQPYLISCELPETINITKVPLSVSLNEKEFDKPKNNLRVIYNRPSDGQKKGFAVCVKGLDFLHEDLSVRLVEWIELLNAMGVDKIFMYSLHIHPNITKVLRYYESLGKVQVIPLTLPGGQPNVAGFQHIYLKNKISHKRFNEVVPYNDCLYKNLYLFDYIVMMDIDEIIMPMGNVSSWADLMAKVVSKAKKETPEGHSSYYIRHAFFLADRLEKYGWNMDIPKYMYMLQHVQRTKYKLTNEATKAFHDTEKVITVHNHFALSCFGGCTRLYVDPADAQLQHYRPECETYCNESVKDTTIWKYQNKVVYRSIKVLDELGFFKKYEEEHN